MARTIVNTTTAVLGMGNPLFGLPGVIEASEQQGQAQQEQVTAPVAAKRLFAELETLGARVVRQPQMVEIVLPNADFFVRVMPWPTPAAVDSLRAWAAPLMGEVEIDLTEEERLRLAGATAAGV